jgi:hypothetical protein
LLAWHVDYREEKAAYEVEETNRLAKEAELEMIALELELA